VRGSGKGYFWLQGASNHSEHISEGLANVSEKRAYHSRRWSHFFSRALRHGNGASRDRRTFRKSCVPSTEGPAVRGIFVILEKMWFQGEKGEITRHKRGGRHPIFKGLFTVRKMLKT